MCHDAFERLITILSYVLERDIHERKIDDLKKVTDNLSEVHSPTKFLWSDIVWKRTTEKSLWWIRLLFVTMETSMNDGLKYHASTSDIQTDNENDLENLGITFKISVLQYFQCINNELIVEVTDLEHQGHGNGRLFIKTTHRYDLCLWSITV